jgi:hypothetical protein
VPGIYRPRHPERTVLYRVLFHHFDLFLVEYERRFEREYGYFRPVVREVVDRYLDCGNPRSGKPGSRMDYLEFIARVTSHIPDKGQVMVRYYGLYANAHRGKVGKASRVPAALGLIEEDPPPRPSKGWAEMIRKVYEVEPMICPRCGGKMKVVAFLAEPAVVDRIIPHLALTFAAEKPPPVHVYETVALAAAEQSGEYE